ncbi:MAG: hypothetical protein HY320_15005 [Armatimonadetes bacterium]|nr:hypothetical protein [Armatimonadota bacterium]
MSTIVCLGEALIDFVADEAGVTLVECPGFRKAAGGAPANVAAGVARLGAPAAFVGKVGDDPFGRFLQQTLAEARVDTRGMRFDPEVRTGLAFVSLTASGERDFVFYRHPSADMRLQPEELPHDLLDSCSVFHFGSISLITEPSRSATLAAVARARTRGALVSYDPNLRPPLWPNLEEARRAILAVMPLADVVKVNEEEAEFLFGTPNAVAAAAAILKRGPRLACVTRGAAGCVLAAAAGQVSIPGFSVAVQDTTGAGDGFVAALLVRLRQSGAAGDEAWLRETGRFANAVGALTCTQKGAIPALPTAKAVAVFLASRPGERLELEGPS